MPQNFHALNLKALVEINLELESDCECTSGCCQELDGSGLLSVSKTVMLWVKGSVIQWSEIQKRAQSSNWIEDEKESGIVK